MGKSNLKETFNDFCTTTTAHGFSYLGTQSKNVKICWVVILSLAFVFGVLHSYTLVSQYLQYDYNESVVTNTKTSLMFPDVTICDTAGIAESSFSQ